MVKKNDQFYSQQLPLAILQADHSGKITSEERVSQSARFGEWCRTQPPASMIHWDSFPNSIFPFENCHGWAESSELVSGHESTISPDCRILWLKHLSFLLTLASWIIGFWAQAAEPGFSNNYTIIKLNKNFSCEIFFFNILQLHQMHTTRDSCCCCLDRVFSWF